MHVLKWIIAIDADSKMIVQDVATCWPVETHVRSLAAARPLSVCRSQTLDDKRRYRHRWKHVRGESPHCRTRT